MKTERTLTDWTWSVRVTDQDEKYTWVVYLANVRQTLLYTTLQVERWIGARIRREWWLVLGIDKFTKLGHQVDRGRLYNGSTLARTVWEYERPLGSGHARFPVRGDELAGLGSEARRTLSGYALLDWLRESSLPVVPSILSNGEVTWPET